MKLSMTLLSQVNEASHKVEWSEIAVTPQMMQERR